MKYIEQNLISQLNGNTFSSFDELNKEVMRLTDRLNNDDRAGRRSRTRSQIYQEYDLPFMRPLPEGELELYEYKEMKVPNNYHIAVNGRYYSVPYQRFGEKVLVKITADKIQICSQNNEFICEHQITNDPRNRYTTVEEHMPESHKAVKRLMEKDEGDYLLWADRIGPNMKKLIQGVLARPKYPQQAYKSCAAILHACDKLQNAVGDKAAENCLAMNILTVKGFRAELDEVKKQHNLMDHENIRGGGYYK